MILSTTTHIYSDCLLQILVKHFGESTSPLIDPDQSAAWLTTSCLVTVTCTHKTISCNLV